MPPQIPTRKQCQSPPANTRTTTQKWIPKLQVHKMPNNTAYVCKQLLVTPVIAKQGSRVSQSPTTSRWQPKVNKTGMSSQVLANTSNLETSKQLRMCLRAFELQKLLFGVSSVLLPPLSWKAYVRRQQGYKPIPRVPFKEALRRQQGYQRLPNEVMINRSSQVY